MDRQISVSAKTTRTELLVELMRESKGSATNVILNVESVPHFLNTQVSLIVFNAMLKGYPKKLYWYSSSQNIINFLKSSNVINFWKPPIDQGERPRISNQQPDSTSKASSQTTSQTKRPQPSLENLQKNKNRFTAKNNQAQTKSTTSENTTQASQSIKKTPKKEDKKIQKGLFARQNQAGIQSVLNKQEIEKELSNLNNPDFNNLDNLIQKLEDTKDALENKKAERIKETSSNPTRNWIIGGVTILVLVIVIIGAVIIWRSNG